jgi:hypothetical protein
MTRLLLLLALAITGCSSSPDTARPATLVVQGREVTRVPAPAGRMWKFLTTSPSITVAPSE